MEWEHLPRAPQELGGEIEEAMVDAVPEAVEEAEADSVWEQLLQLAKSGDIRAIKLYYEMQEKRQRTGDGDAAAMTQMAQIRRAVFGEDGED